jgi:hypothetical protein
MGQGSLALNFFDSDVKMDFDSRCLDYNLCLYQDILNDGRPSDLNRKLKSKSTLRRD